MASNKKTSMDVGRWLKSSEGQRFLSCMLISLIWGLIAHAYAYLSPMFSHDGLAVYEYPAEADWKISLGRIFVPLYRSLFHDSLSLPWISGLFVFLWIGLAVYFVARIFNLRSLPVIALVSGVLSTNYTVTALSASYIHDLDADMLGMFMAVLAAHIWNENKEKRRPVWLLGALPLVVALGLYQSYISVTIVLVMFACMMSLLEGKKAQGVVIEGLKAIAMLAAGAVLYLIALKVGLAVYGVELSSGNGNSLSNMWTSWDESIFSRLSRTYRYSGLLYMLKPIAGGAQKALGVANVIYFACGIFVVGAELLRRRMGLLEKALLVVLGVLLPFGINVTCFLGGEGKILTVFACWLLYILVLLLVRWYACHAAESKPRFAGGLKIVSGVMMAVILLGNVQTSNAVYLKKDLERQSSLSLMTRVVDAMNDVEGYEPGVTPVAFAKFNNIKDTLQGFRPYTRLQAATSSTQMSYIGTYENYFRFILNEPLNPLNDVEVNEFLAMEEVQNMPVFPAKDSLRMINGTLVVKLNDFPDNAATLGSDAAEEEN